MTQLAEATVRKRGIEKHEIDTAGGEPIDNPIRIAGFELGRACLERIDIGLQLFGNPAVLLDEEAALRTPRQCLEAERAGTGKKIEAAFPRYPEHQPVEQRLADSLAAGTEALGVDHGQPPAAPVSGYNTQPTRGVAPLASIPSLLSFAHRRSVSEPDRESVVSTLSLTKSMFKKKPSEEPVAETNGEKKAGFIKRLRARINRGDSWLTYDLANLVPGGKIDDEVLEELESLLVMADVGVETTEKIIAKLEARLARNELKDLDALRTGLHEAITEILAPVSRPLTIERGKSPFVILMVGVNGAGKTTTIGKLARRFKDEGLEVMLAAGDTFRAAAVEQLTAWGERNDVPVVAQHSGADPAAVVFDAWEAAEARGVDVLLADTAGRLQSQQGLMDELAKVKRVIGRRDPDAPHEVMLVVDASQGQNALVQAEKFHEALGLTGITVTKLDGTAKGGVMLAIADRLGVPVRYIGIGEAADDMQAFDAGEFADALLAKA